MSAACIAASIRRLGWVVSPTWFDLHLLAAALRAGEVPGVVRLRDEIDRCPAAAWEAELLAALDAPPLQRTALTNEQLGEFDWRLGRWGRVPRVCASIATSTGFFTACIALVDGLGNAGSDAIGGLVPALDSLAFGIVGASFCAAVHVRARRLVGERRAAVDAFVESVGKREQA